jgi:hypothetical protein
MSEFIFQAESEEFSSCIDVHGEPTVDVLFDYFRRFLVSAGYYEESLELVVEAYLAERADLKNGAENNE